MCTRRARGLYEVGRGLFEVRVRSVGGMQRFVPAPVHMPEGVNVRPLDSLHFRQLDAQRGSSYCRDGLCQTHCMHGDEDLAWTRGITGCIHGVGKRWGIGVYDGGVYGVYEWCISGV